MTAATHEHAARPGQGIGARVLRKEDARHLHGRGRFVSDMVMPRAERGRVPAQPGRARAHRLDAAAGRPVPNASFAARDDGRRAGHRAPTRRCRATRSRRSRRSPRARCASSASRSRWRRADARRGRGPGRAGRARVSRSCPCSSMRHARARPTERRACTRTGTTTSSSRSHVDKRFRRCMAKQRPVVVRRAIELARQCMVPMEGKAVVAYWDEPGRPAGGLQRDAGAAHDAHRPRASASASTRGRCASSRRTSAAASATSACSSRRSCASPGWR